jgi:hypothetical protein
LNPGAISLRLPPIFLHSRNFASGTTALFGAFEPSFALAWEAPWVV